MNGDRIFVGRGKELAQFTSTLEHEGKNWVFALAGEGGIGKTWLQAEMVSRSQDYGAITGLFDFYYADLQTETGLLGAIGSQLGLEHFPWLSQSLEECGTAPTSVREGILGTAIEHFTSGLRKLATERTVALFFDTFEKATETGVARWFVEKVLPQMRGSAIVVLAGRSMFRLADGYEAKGAPGYVPAIMPLTSEEVCLLMLAPFSLQEVQEYLKEYLARRGEGDVPLHVDPKSYADLAKPPREVPIICEKSEGHPIIVALAADWLAEWGTGYIMDLVDLPPEEFKEKLVSKVRDLETPEDGAIARMAHIYHRFDAEILDAVYTELGETGLDSRRVIQNLSRFSFVKYWPETGHCLLHDEMQRLVEQYVWNRIDATQGLRRAISADVVKYYDQILARETDERKRWSLEAERMYHLLYSDLERGYLEFWDTADKAWAQYKLDFVKMLLSKGEEVNDKLKDPLLTIICRVIQAWIGLEEWNLEEAQELAQSVLDDPVGTQWIRANALTALGTCASRRGESDLAIQRYQRALGLYRDLEDRLVREEELPAEHGIPRLSVVRTEIATWLSNIGITYRRKGLLDEAIVYYNQARELALQERNLQWWATTLNNIANVERLRGNLPLARSLCEQGLRYRERLQRERPGDVGLSHSTLGLVLRDMGEYDRAQEHFERAEEIFEQSKYKQGLVWSPRNLGWVCYVRGKATDDEMGRRRWFREALRHYDRSRQVCKKFHIELELSNLLNKIGIAQRALGYVKEAQETFSQSLELAREYGDNPFIANNLVRLAEMTYATGDLKQVAVYADELRRFQEQGFAFRQAYAEMEELLAQVALDDHKYEEAFQHLGENYAHLARLNRWRFDRKIRVLREFFNALPDDEWRRRCGEQLIHFWEEQGLARDYADLTAICEEYIME